MQAIKTPAEIYEDEVNEKVNHFINHPKYDWLRKYTDDAISFHTGFGYYQIKAADYMDRIIKAPLSLIEDWLNGKNNLEWELIEKEIRR